MSDPLQALAREIDRASMLNQTVIEAVPVRVLTEARDRIEELEAENAKLREAGSYMLGHHPTDPEHPAFMNTHEYGVRVMAEMLEQGDSEND